MGNLNFGEYDEETAQQEKEESDAGGAGFIKLKVGRNVLRVLPPAQGQKKIFRTVYQHWIEIAKKSIICARLEAKKSCAICQKVEELKKSKLKLDQDLGSDLFARRRVFCNVIDRKEPEKGVQVLACGKTIHEQLLALRTDDLAGADYSHPLKGYDIVIERTGTGKNDTKYKVFMAKNSTPLGPTEEVMQEWIDMQHNLDAYAKLPTMDEVKQLLSGEVPDEAAEAPPAKGGTNKPRRSAQDDTIDVEAEDSSQ